MFKRIAVAAIAALAGAAAPGAQALDLQLADKIVLVTGSTSNIGYSAAKAFLKENPETAQQIEDRVRQQLGMRGVAVAVGDEDGEVD